MSTDRNTRIRRQRHHDALASLHANPGTEPGLRIWRKLRRIEQRAHAAAEAACSTPGGAAAWESEVELATAAVRRAFGGVLPDGFFVNGDPRGYALKLDPDYDATMYGNITLRRGHLQRGDDPIVPDGMATDWGGYGLLAAEID